MCVRQPETQRREHQVYSDVKVRRSNLPQLQSGHHQAEPGTGFHKGLVPAEGSKTVSQYAKGVSLILYSLQEQRAIAKAKADEARSLGCLWRGLAEVREERVKFYDGLIDALKNNG
jgi:hypothetical protein